MNVLVTGSTGYVGTWIKKTAPENIELGCVGHKEYDKMGWDWEAWEAIIHLAPIAPTRVLDYAKKHGSRVLFASSGAVYEGQGKYADDKRAWEEECQESGVDCVIARLFATSGMPFQKNKALSAFVENALHGDKLQVWGDGSTVRSYLYGFDVGTWFWKLLLDGKGTYNVGSMISYSMLQVAEMVSSIVPAKIEFIEHEEMPTPKFYYPYAILDTLALGCRETIGLKDAIREMIKYG